MILDQNLKVLSLKQIKKDLYEVNINGEIYNFVTETVLKYRLVKGKEIIDLNEIVNFNNLNTNISKIKNYILKYPKSIYNFRIYLKEKYENIDLDYIINELIKLDFLNDKRYAVSKANNLLNRGYGLNYIKNYLNYNEHIDNNIIEEVVADLTVDSADLNKLIVKLANKYAKLDYYNKKNKIINYLLRKGYNKIDFMADLEKILN